MLTIAKDIYLLIFILTDLHNREIITFADSWGLAIIAIIRERSLVSIASKICFLETEL